MALGQAMEPKYVKKYMLAGRAIVTLKSKATGKHYTYRIKDVPGRMPPLYWVGILSGPDNTSSYTYLGMIKLSKFEHSYKSAIPDQSPSCKAFRWMWERLRAEKFAELDSQVVILHSGRCSRCGRLLTDPESVSRGIGPVCRTKTGRVS